MAYGEAPSQGIDVFLPASPGPHPIAVLIHGGCWSNTTAGREQMRHLGPELTRRGIAVWSIGYRRANEAGGGYPGTYQDVSAALDRLVEDAEAHHLDLSRVVLVGHSAGGHLALWAASRVSLPGESPLRAASRLESRTVISLGGVGDLATFARFVPLLCGPGVLERLAPSDKLTEVSPAALAPAGSVVMVSGVLDRLVPPWVAYDYARALRAKSGIAPRLINLPDAGHFDLVTPSTPAWKEVRDLIETALKAR
ncbi:alpha/beta hydrolase [Methylobacterium nigriterrae]|uniref:alpha/beta hydrolase n=1 Tax=Methylobacterium nigriterrae TaxID=3127512 RepID=UPI003013C04B